MTTPIDLLGTRFDRLLVVERYGRTPAGQLRWRCECDCGAIVTAAGADLRNHRTKSCGCLRAEHAKQRATTHGEAARGRKSPEYQAWANMIARCEDTGREDHCDYGGRGISICYEWRYGDDHGRSAFACFLADMGRKPPKTSLDRRDNMGNYEPSNCHWATDTFQANNKRTNRAVLYRGEITTFAEAWRKAGKVISYGQAHLRLKRGWTIEAALEMPAIPVLRGKRSRGDLLWPKRHPSDL